MYITDTEIPQEWRLEMTRYLACHVNDDGGWGLHLKDTTKVFATTLYYIVLRILGMEPSHPLAARARDRLLSLGSSISKDFLFFMSSGSGRLNSSLGGAIGVPQWGKHWLACLNLYEWDGVNPVPPEFWCVLLRKLCRLA